jgi:putative methanogenesis marker 16 metalloprotein
MKAPAKTVAAINARLERGEAVVMTAMEFKRDVRRGRHFTPADVDVVTTATRAVMSGTSATLVVPVGGDAAVRRLWLNGVPCITGSRPGDGHIEAVVFGTAESRDHRGRYGGGHLMRDIVEGKPIEFECLDDLGALHRGTVTLDDLPFARIYSFRNDYQNYTAFTNVANQRAYRDNPASIFTCRPMAWLKGLSTSGSGELNPLENDPEGRVLRAGMKVLVNGVVGTLIGYGTRSTPGTRNLSLAADLTGMDPQFMGGFKTSHGVEVTNGIAVPFPITGQDVIDALAGCLDEAIPLRIADLGDRIPIAEATYADLWEGAPREVVFDAARCICCSFQCPAEYYCPMGAISWRDKEIDANLCIACGACTSNCPGGAFMGKGGAPAAGLGTVPAFGTDLEVTFRLSNRLRAEALAERLKGLLEAGDFRLTDSVLGLDLGRGIEP